MVPRLGNVRGESPQPIEPKGFSSASFVCFASCHQGGRYRHSRTI